MTTSSTAPTNTAPTNTAPRTRHDLRGFTEWLPQWLERYRLDRPGSYTRHLAADAHHTGRPDPYGSAGAANILYTLGILPSSADERAAWVTSLQSFQDPTTGRFDDATHSRFHTTAHLSAALELFEARPAHRLTFLDELTDPTAITGFLDGLDWSNPWRSSHDGAGSASALILTDAVGPEWTAAYLDWLDAEVDPDTGVWRRGTMLPLDQWPGRFANLGGAFHYHFVYEHLRQPWPAVEALIDTCLTLLYDSACEFAIHDVGFRDIDLVFCLSRARRQTTHRSDEVAEALSLLVDRVVALLDDPAYRESAAFDDVHVAFGALCALAELQRAVPGAILTTKPLRLVLDRRPFI